MAAWFVTPAASAASVEDREQTAAEALAEEVWQYPDAVVVGNRAYHPDGWVFVAADSGTLSLSQCANGRFCVWERTNYRGSFRYRTVNGMTWPLAGTVNSLYNNRPNAARLTNSAGTASTCYGPRAQRGTVPAAYRSPRTVYLSTGTSC